MAEFGWTVPCLVGEDGELIAGHGRVLAATQLGLTEAPVIVLGHLTEAQRRAYRIADNKLLTLGIVTTAGVVIGSAIVALATRTFRWEGFANFSDLRSQLLGAVLMGFGGMTAGGCAVGAGLSYRGIYYALGDALGFGQISLRAGEVVQAVAQPGAGEEASGEIILLARLAQGGDGSFGVLLGVQAWCAAVQ